MARIQGPRKVHRYTAEFKMKAVMGLGSVLQDGKMIDGWMARLFRIEFPGALYHVFVRGNERKAVFRGGLTGSVLPDGKMMELGDGYVAARVGCIRYRRSSVAAP